MTTDRQARRPYHRMRLTPVDSQIDKSSYFFGANYPLYAAPLFRHEATNNLAVCRCHLLLGKYQLNDTVVAH